MFFIIEHRYTITAVILFVTGLLTMLLDQNLIKKVVGFNIMDSATFILLAAQGFEYGRIPASLNDGGANPAQYVNPIPAGLVLTGIVVSVSVSAFSLALIQRIHKKYGTINMKELLLRVRKDREED